MALAAASASALAAGPYPVNQCVGTRSGNLGCSANDVTVAQVEVTNGVTSCVAGTTVNVGLRLRLQSNASSRYDIGVFVARDGKPPELTVPAGGSADCAVSGIPLGPAPLADLNGNACGDITRSATPAVVDLGVVSVLCVPDQNGNLRLPTTVTWEQNANGTCQAPPAAWVEAGAPSKCNAAADVPVPVSVVGALTIVKVTEPAAAPGAFAFSATGVAPAAFSLSHGLQQVLTTPPLGAAGTVVSVTEQALAGWDPEAAIACVNADGGPAPFVAIDPAARRVTATFSTANSRATCTFTNRAEGRIRIVKNATGGDDTFQFTGVANVPVATAGGTGQAVVPGLRAGDYIVTELVPAGWRLTAITCTDPSGGTQVDVPGATAYVSVAAGEEVACTFTNTKTPSTGTIRIVKAASGGDATFPFASSIPGGANFSIATTGGAAPARSFANVAPGLYTIQEQVPPGWSLTSITCADPTGNSAGAGTVATVNLAPGETVTCTFANTATASVIVEKVALGGDANFAFGGSAAFAIATSSGTGRDATTFASVAAGAPLTITETAPAGWAFTGATCRDSQSGAPLGTAIANGVQVTPVAGRQAICTFTNTKLAQLTIVELSTPKSPQAFAYAATGAGLADFSLFDDGSGANVRVFANLVPGAVRSVSQAAVPGWFTPGIVCSDRFATLPADRTAVDLATRTVQPNLQPGENLTCLFVNVQAAAGTISVAKAANGGDGPFAFTNSGGVPASVTNPQAFTITTVSGAGSQSLTGLAPGAYTITETVPAGWLAPAAVQCTVLSGTSTTITPVANGASIVLGQTGIAVDSVHCAFVNTAAARITIVEDAVPDSPQSFAYAATGSGVPAAFPLVNDGAPAPADRVSFPSLAAGSYRFDVAPPAGWVLTGIACTGNASAVTDTSLGRATLDVEPGDDATCTFTHARTGTISVTKLAPAAAAGDVFPFLGPASLAGDYTAGQTRSGSFVPGTYPIAEAVPDGWTLSNIACAGGSVTYTGASLAPTNAFEPGDNTANVTLAAGDAVACTFTNAVPGAQIVVEKVSVGGSGPFSFTGVEDFQIDTRLRLPGGYVIAVAPGTHAVTEIVPRGWRLTGIACTGTSTVNLPGATASVTVAAGERVRCTFTNEKLGRIEIVKTLRGERTTAFSFSAPLSLVPAGLFTLTPSLATGSARRVFADVPSGSYTFGEIGPPNGFRLLSVQCTDPSGGTVSSPVTGEAIIGLAAGETVTCAFDNATLGTIVVGAVSFLGQDAFAFTATNLPTASSFTLATAPFNAVSGFAAQAFGNLPPTVYTITPAPAPPGWTFVYVDCVSDSGEQRWSISGGTVTIALPDGETMRCYYFYRPAAAVGPGEALDVPTLSPFATLALALLVLGGGAWFSRRRLRD